MNLARRLGLALFALTAATAGGPARAQVAVRVAGEFQVNLYTENRQTRPAVASDAGGGFVVVWESAGGQDGGTYGVFGRRYTSLGAAIGAEFQVNTYTTDNQHLPSIAAEADGDFVVVWTSRFQDALGDGVFARRYTSAGVPVTSEFQVNVLTAFVQNTPAVALDPDGDFVIVWQSYGQDNHRWGIFARRYASDGAALAGEFQVNTYTTVEQQRPALAIAPDGDFVIAWQSNSQDDPFGGVFARLFSSNGAFVGNEFQVNTYTPGYQEWPAVTTIGGGEFVVAWSSGAQDGSQYGIFARRFSSAGTALASEFMVNSFTNTSQRYVAMSRDGDGDFVVVWHSNTADGASYGVFGRAFSSAGTALASEFQVNRYTISYQRFPAVAAETNGDFVVAWGSSSQDGGSEGVFAQRFGLFPLLDLDANGDVTALNDGLLLIRAQFRFIGTALTSDVVSGGCNRCLATDIKTYADGLGTLVDIDGNGVVRPLKDGLLVLRRLSGFGGTALTAGAIGTGCTRCDETAIEDYLDSLGI